MSAPFTSGPWSLEEHDRFVEALNLHGRDWSAVTVYIGTNRKQSSIRSHAQRYFMILYNDGQPLPSKVLESGSGYTLSGKPLDLTGGAWTRFKGIAPRIVTATPQKANKQQKPNNHVNGGITVIYNKSGTASYPIKFDAKINTKFYSSIVNRFFSKSKKQPQNRINTLHCFIFKLDNFRQHVLDSIEYNWLLGGVLQPTSESGYCLMRTYLFDKFGGVYERYHNFKNFYQCFNARQQCLTFIHFQFDFENQHGIVAPTAAYHDVNHTDDFILCLRFMYVFVFVHLYVNLV